MFANSAMHSFTEENYLKAIYKLQEQNGETVVNSDLAKALEVQSASVTDMLKKMAKKKLINYEKSKGFKLTEKGKHIAISIIRKHRLWEVFLVEKLGFGWDEVHEMAEQLEHIQSEKLIDRLDQYLVIRNLIRMATRFQMPMGYFQIKIDTAF